MSGPLSPATGGITTVIILIREALHVIYAQDFVVAHWVLGSFHNGINTFLESKELCLNSWIYTPHLVAAETFEATTPPLHSTLIHRSDVDVCHILSTLCALTHGRGPWGMLLPKDNEANGQTTRLLRRTSVDRTTKSRQAADTLSMEHCLKEPRAEVWEM